MQTYGSGYSGTMQQPPASSPTIGAPSGYGGDARNRIAQALTNVQNPPPAQIPPPLPQTPMSGGAPPMGGAMPMGGGAPMGGAMPAAPMPSQPMGTPGGMPGPAAQQTMPGMMPGQPTTTPQY